MKSRNLSPSRLNVATVMKIAVPGARITHGAVCNIDRPLFIIAPHSAVGGIAPNPKNDSPANSIMIVPMSRAAVTSTGPAIFGRTCTNKIFVELEPAIFAASRYGIDRIVKTSPRDILAYFGQPIIAKAAAAFKRPPPNAPAAAIAKTICGKAKNISDSRIKNTSSLPPL